MLGGDYFGKNVWSKTANNPSAAMAACRPRIVSGTSSCRSPGSASLPRKTCEKAVGSRTGAVFRRSGLAVAPRFLWECLNSPTVNPFPAPATSHPACGFPALGAPVCFVSRFMGPIVPGRLSFLPIDAAGSRYTDPASHIAIHYSSASRQGLCAPGHVSDVSGPSFLPTV